MICLLSRNKSFLTFRIIENSLNCCTHVALHHSFSLDKTVERAFSWSPSHVSRCATHNSSTCSRNASVAPRQDDEMLPFI